MLLATLAGKQSHFGIADLGCMVLPLATHFAESGFHVFRFDIDESNTNGLTEPPSTSDSQEKGMREEFKP